MERPAADELQDAVLYGVLAVGVFAIGAAAVLIRLADAEPVTIAAYRMSVGAVTVGGFALITARSQFAKIRGRDIGWLLLAGAFLAVHFASWITSLQLISLANSVFLVTTTPIFVATGSFLFLRERVGMVMIAAVVLSLGGGAVLAAGEPDASGGTFVGNLLAVAGAMAMAGNLLVGRRLRRQIPLLPYVTVVYCVAAVLLIGAALVSGAQMTGMHADVYLWMVLAGLFPQTVGHSILNWALAHTSATTVAMSTRVEPIIATLLAVPVLGEVPPWTILPGGLLLFLGVGLAMRAEMTAGR